MGDGRAVRSAGVGMLRLTSLAWADRGGGTQSRCLLAGELLSLRKARGLTQRQLSETTGIQQSEISRIEAAHANPTVGTVSALARALGAEVRLASARERTPRSRVVARSRRGDRVDVGLR